MKTKITLLSSASQRGMKMNVNAFMLIFILTICLCGSIHAQTIPQIEWIRQYGTTVADVSRGICTNGNATFVSGYTSGSFPGFTNAGSSDAYVAKYDPEGNLLWLDQFGTSGTDYAWAVATDASGIYVSGYTNGLLGQTSYGDYDAFIRKYDHSGNVLWTSQFGTPKLDRPEDALRVDETGIYIIGFTWGSFPGFTVSGLRDLFIAKFSLDGTMLWIRQEGTTGNDNCSGIHVEGSGIYVCSYENSTGKNDACISRYTHEGTKVWSTLLATSGDDLAHEITADETGLYMSGQTSGTFPGQTYAGGSYDSWVAKYDRNGVQQWLREFGTAGPDYAYGIFANTSGIYVDGYTTGTFPGQPGNIGGEDIFVAKYNQNGDRLWIKQIGSAKVGTSIPGDFTWSIDVAASFAYINGYTNGDLGPTQVGGSDAFLMKLTVNLPPVASCGDDQLRIITEMAELDGSGSSDSDGDAITYKWTIVSRPDGSTATLSSRTVVNPTFVPDMAGTYVIELVVKDGTEESNPCSVTITVQTPQEATYDLIDDVQELVEDGVLNHGQGNALIVKLEAAIAKMNQGNFKAAINIMNAFINQVNSFRLQGILSDEQADPLIDSAKRIINVLIQFLTKAGMITGPMDASLTPCELSWPAPNPCNSLTTIQYSLPVDEFVTLKVFDSFGNEVSRLVNEYQSTGKYTVLFSVEDLSSGIYFYRLQAGSFSATKKLIVQK